MNINSYIYNIQNNNSEETFNQYFKNEINNQTTDNSEINNETINADTINKEEISPEDFDINTIYTDSELKDAYDSFFYIIYPTFEEFKKEMNEYLYETYYYENTN